MEEGHVMGIIMAAMTTWSRNERATKTRVRELRLFYKVNGYLTWYHEFDDSCDLDYSIRD